MAPVVGGVTHDPIKVRHQLEQARAASAIAVAHCHCIQHHRRRRLLSLPLPNTTVAFSASAIAAVTAAAAAVAAAVATAFAIAVAIAVAAATTIATTAAVVNCCVFVNPTGQILLRCQAGDDEKCLVLVGVGVQTELIGEVTALVVARIEQKPERLCTGDEFEEVSYVVQKGLRAQRHLKDWRAKLAHPFVRVLGGPTRFWLAGCPKFFEG